MVRDWGRETCPALPWACPPSRRDRQGPNSASLYLRSEMLQPQVQRLNPLIRVGWAGGLLDFEPVRSGGLIHRPLSSFVLPLTRETHGDEPHGNQYLE